MANLDIPLEKFTFIKDKNILEEFYAERTLEIRSTEDFLSLPPTEAYLNNAARIERVAREKAEKESYDEIAALEASNPYPQFDISSNSQPTYLFEPDCLYKVDASGEFHLHADTKFFLSYNSSDDSIPLIVDDGLTDTEKDDDIIE